MKGLQKMNDFNLKKAIEHVSSIKRGKGNGPFNSRENGYSLREFAKARDEINFRVIVEWMREGIKNQKSARLFRKEPLALIESICMVMDHSSKINYYNYQTYRGIKIKRPSIGTTQRFFQKLYGSHFYVN